MDSSVSGKDEIWFLPCAITFRKSYTDYKALHYEVFSKLLLTSFFWDLNILLRIQSSNTLNPHSFLKMTDQVSLPYKTTDKIIAVYILIFIFWIVNWKTKDSAPNDRNIPWLHPALDCCIEQVLTSENEYSNKLWIVKYITVVLCLLATYIYFPIVLEPLRRNPNKPNNFGTATVQKHSKCSCLKLHFSVLRRGFIDSRVAY